MQHPSLPRFAAQVLVGYLIFELYIALRPANLTQQISEWMESNRGRFAQFYAQRDRHLGDAPRDDE